MKNKQIIIHHISDTHGYHFEPQEADILIHSGDACSHFGTEDEFQQFLFQLEAVKRKYKQIIFIPGNHERLLSLYFLMDKYKKLLKEEFNTTLLFNETIEMFGIKFGGYSYTQIFKNWAFEKSANERKTFLKKFPSVDILISHCPPKSICRFGDEFLDVWLLKNKIKLMLCGHDHENKGEYTHLNKITKIYNSATTSNLITYVK